MISSESIDALLARRLQTQREAFLRDGPPSANRRRNDLTKLKRALISRRSDIERAIQADFGHRATHETAIMELLTLVHGIDYLRRRLHRWMRPERRPTPWQLQPARSYVLYQPVGVVGIVAPWNYPLSLALMPLATALAAGNRAMIKPSESTPATSALLEAILSELFDKEQVAVVTGDALVGAAFSALPFDHLLFTGSTEVGRKVMQAAAANLVPVTMELGGKSPVVIEPGHSEAAAESIAYGKLANAGQTCIAPDYVLLPRQEMDTFVDAYDRAVRRLYPEGPDSVDYTSIIDERHHRRLLTLLDDAREKGARIIEVGNRQRNARDVMRKFAPVLVTGVTDDMLIMQQEIFGPLLPVLTYEDIDEAIDFINARPRPLALYSFGAQGASREKLLTRTTAGNVTINNTLMHYAQDALPFGGIGLSGMGAYHGVEGFRALSHAKGILVQSRWQLGKLLRPPYGFIANAIIKAMLR